MAAPTIPASNTQATQTTGGGTQPFTVQWWTFFNNLLTFVNSLSTLLTTGPLGPVPLVGVINGSSAAAGNVGEYLKSIVAVSPGTSLNNNAAKTITSLALTAGDWDLWGELDPGFPTAAGNITFVSAALWTTPASVSPAATAYPSDGVAFSQYEQASMPYAPTIILGPMSISISVGATYYLSGFVSFSGGGTCPIGGAIRARRRR